MSTVITDYASLLSAAADWANRADLTARMPDLVALAELELRRKVRGRVLEADYAMTGVVGSRFVPLPADYQEPLNLWWNNGVDREPLRFIPPELIDAWVTPSRPLQWTVDGSNVAFECPCDQTYGFTFRYRQKLALSASAPTNNLLTQSPDAYLFATRVQIALYLEDDAGAQRWEQRLGKTLHDIREVEQQQKGLSTLSVEPTLLTWGRGRDFNINRGY